jgi:hypothetical protein
MGSPSYMWSNVDQNVIMRCIPVQRQVLFYVILLSHNLYIYTTFQIYAIIFALKQFGIDDTRMHLSSVTA